MTHNFKPGDVAMLQPGTVAERIGLRIPDGWRTVGGLMADDTDPSPDRHRPLVVIDPEDEDAADHLCKALVEACYAHGNTVTAHNGIHTSTMQAALRSLTTPPRPEEPTGLGAVVEDAEGEKWIRWEIVGRHPKPWTVAGSIKPNRAYDEFTAVRVLAEGWSE